MIYGIKAKCRSIRLLCLGMKIKSTFDNVNLVSDKNIVIFIPIFT
ncbi:hypothetical protein [Clostridium isatidis]|jgi:hypothetical protein|nr:hypothetical protein [Clostridium isatidis]